MTIEQMYFWYKIGEVASFLVKIVLPFATMSGLGFVIFFIMNVATRTADRSCAEAKISGHLRNAFLIFTIIFACVLGVFGSVSRISPSQKEVLYYACYQEYKQSGVIDNIKSIIDAVTDKMKNCNE